MQVFDPDANTVTVSRMPPDMRYSFWAMPKAMIGHFEATHGENVTPESGKHQGKDVQIYRRGIASALINIRIEMFAEPDQNIPLFLNVKTYHPRTGQMTQDASSYFDYPDRGPESMYDVGVPNSAKTVYVEEQEAAYGAVFQEAISKIDNQEHWPKPRDLVIAYWQARATKNYDEMTVFWPGSATWNRQVAEREEPEEYVFGTAQVSEMDGHLIVPYASRRYYEKLFRPQSLGQ